MAEGYEDEGLDVRRDDEEELDVDEDGDPRDGIERAREAYRDSHEGSEPLGR